MLFSEPRQIVEQTSRAESHFPEESCGLSDFRRPDENKSVDSFSPLTYVMSSRSTGKDETMTQGEFLKSVLAGEEVSVTGCTEQALRDESDLNFLKSAFNKLLLNFTWWVNRKDRFGKNMFEGRFFGLDNIGVFDRTSSLLTGGYLEADGTAWIN